MYRSPYTGSVRPPSVFVKFLISGQITVDTLFPWAYKDTDESVLTPAWQAEGLVLQRERPGSKEDRQMFRVQW